MPVWLIHYKLQILEIGGFTLNKEQSIGFFDSGVGGLTIAGEVVKILPGENIIYYADNLHIPYGPKSASEVRGYVLTIIAYLVHQQNAKYIVIACNTAAVAALEEARKVFDVQIIGPVEEGANKAVNLSKNQRIGILATEGTINSGGYQDAIKQLNSDAFPVAVPCPGLAAIVESGQLNGSKVEHLIHEFLTPILNAGCDSVVLGCTHYPYLIDLIKKISDGRLDIIFPGTEIAGKIKTYLQTENLLNPGENGKKNYQTSDLSKISPEFLAAAGKKLELNLDFHEFNIF